MLPKERVLAAFEHRPYDQVPLYQAGFSSQVASYILGRPDAHIGGGIQQWRESQALWEGEQAHQEFLERCNQDALDLSDKLELDYVRPSYWRMPEKPTAKLDEYTYQYGDPNGAYRIMRVDPATELYQVVEQQPAPEPTLEDIERGVEAAESALASFQPPTDVGADIKAAKERFPDRAVPVGGAGLGISNRSQVWLEAVVLRPDLVGRYLECQTGRAEKTCEAMARLGHPFLLGGGDFASNRGPNYSPKSFHELMAPRLKRITEACNRAGGFHMFASDGNLWPVAEDLFQVAHIDAFYEIDGNFMDLRELRGRYPDLTLLGNIRSATLHKGSKAEVIAETRACMEAAKELGSMIIGCSNQVVAGTPEENFWAMMETMHALK
ncbi:MAG: hypothetical protein GW892_01265 [Armatimonadetes bacterium]|nr:hypothetical protein [Armatimonadota bacterium]